MAERFDGANSDILHSDSVMLERDKSKRKKKKKRRKGSSSANKMMRYQLWYVSECASVSFAVKANCQVAVKPPLPTTSANYKKITPLKARTHAYTHSSTYAHSHPYPHTCAHTHSHATHTRRQLKLL